METTSSWSPKSNASGPCSTYHNVTTQKLIEEAAQNACDRIESMMTLVQLSFEAGEADARDIARMTGDIIDPVATCCFGEARELLMSTAPDIARALMALYVAASREPLCYGPTHAVLSDLLFAGVQRAVDLELANAELEQLATETPVRPPEFDKP